MKNQLTVISVGVLLLFSAGINVMQYQSNDELKSKIENKQKEAPVKTEKQELEDIQKTESQSKDLDIDQFTEPCMEYINTMKNSRSTDLSIDKVSKIKSILSENVYKNLAPEMSDEELAVEREKAKNTEEKYISTTTLKSAKPYYYKITDDKAEIVVLYTTNVVMQDMNYTTRYITRMEVTIINNKAIITNILEDSKLSDGMIGE